MPIWIAITFQDRNSPLIEHLSFFHDHTIIIITSITIIIAYLLLSSVSRNFFSRRDRENQEIELFWTSLPVGILIFIAIPSLKILYITDELTNPSLTLKTIGHQWFWRYEYSEIDKLQFDSYIATDESPRLIQTSNHIVLPRKTPIRLIVRSTDVIHSWTIPSLGIKADAIPGRLNQLFILINRIGLLSGQCREICGANHSFIPITISSLPVEEFSLRIKTISFSGWLKHWPLKPK
jgi:cytochrome c oxidase subunit 2